MDTNSKRQFCYTVDLGEDGYKALSRAAERLAMRRSDIVREAVRAIAEAADGSVERRQAAVKQISDETVEPSEGELLLAAYELLRAAARRKAQSPDPAGREG